METTAQARVESPTFEAFMASMQELRESQKETDRIVKRVSRQMGDLHNKFGKIAEHLVAPGIAKRFRELGYGFSEVAAQGYKIVDEKTLQPKAEIDLLLENGEYIIAVEVKAQTKVKNIEHHIRRLEILREFRLKKNDHRKILGAIAGAIYDDEMKQATIEAGMYVIEQSGDTMKINVPNDFVPREW